MPSNRRWSVSDGRTLATVILCVFALFIISASIGASSWELAALGVAMLAAAVTLYVVSAMNNRSFAYVPGTVHVVSISPPPANAVQGRCEMQVVVHAPGIDDVAVKIRDAGVPVSKWPDPGATLPILVALGDPRRVRILWDNVRTHGEVADGRTEVYDAEAPTEASEAYVDLFDYGDVEQPSTEDGYDASRVIEMDVIDPSGLLLEEEPDDLVPPSWVQPQPDPEPADAAAPTEAPAPAESAPAEASGVAEARRKPSPKPRQRRPVETLEVIIPTTSSAMDDSAMTGGGVAVAAPPEPERPTLRIRHLVPAEPAVAAMPEAAPDPDDLDSDPGEIEHAYLQLSPPPGGSPGEGGVRAPTQVRGVGVTLFVSNLSRSVAFYRDVLGFTQVDVGPGSAVLESGDGRIVLRRVLDMAPVDRRLVHLLLEVPDVHSAYDDLRSRGVEFVHRPRAVSRYDQLELWSAAFRDPDGHGIALTKWDVRH